MRNEIISQCVETEHAPSQRDICTLCILTERALTLFIIFLASTTIAFSQNFTSTSPDLDSAFTLAVRTLDTNIHDGLIHAGGGYGGEWTRDCAINSRNAASMLRPSAAVKSLWSVTVNRHHIGHQYWDKIIWVLAAWNHYLWTGNHDFLADAYSCSVNTIRQLEDSCFDTHYRMFRGPAVFQDGIEAYDEPIFDPAKWDDSFVLHHPHGGESLCLSTNLVYAEAYKTLALMARELKTNDHKEWTTKHDKLQKSIKEHLLTSEGRMAYLIDYLGTRHEHQEGLGIAFALLYDLTDRDQTARMMSHVVRSRYGITSIYPCFARNTAERPGRHNVMVWPHVNALFASGCLHKGLDSLFYDELRCQSLLALRCGEGCFYEIYTVEGVPSGGYQCGSLWGKQPDQTWCATGFIRNVIEDLCGIKATPDGLSFRPVGMQDGTPCRLTGISYRNATIDLHIKGHGHRITSCRINNRRSLPHLSSDATGTFTIEIELAE